MIDPELDRIERAEHELERWLVTHAEAGVPELILVGLLRDYADTIDELGYVPRTRIVAPESIHDD